MDGKCYAVPGALLFNEELSHPHARRTPVGNPTAFVCLATFTTLPPPTFHLPGLPQLQNQKYLLSRSPGGSGHIYNIRE